MRDDARESRTEEANRAGELAGGAGGRSRRSFLKATAAGVGGVGLAAAAVDDAAATVVRPVSAVGRDGTQLLRATRTTVRGADDAGDNATTATVVSTGETVAGALDGDEEDWYAFDVSGETRLRAELSRERDGGVVAASLYDPSGAFLDLMHVDDGEGTLETRTDAVGGHLLRVTNVRGGSGAYAVSVAADDAPTGADGAPTGTGAGAGEAADGGRVERWIEAESASASPAFAPFEVVDGDGTASGAHIRVPDGEGDNPRDPPERGRARYSFDVPEEGTYAVWGRVRSHPGGDGDSFYAEVDGTGPVNWKAAEGTEWRWARLTGGGGIAPITPRLDAGEHALTVTWRDDGVALDRLLITDDESFEPTGRGGEGSGSGDDGGDGDGDGSVPPAVAQSPTNGQPHTLPTRIEAEEFDEGGPGVAYADADGGNRGGAYRSTGVDVEAAESAGGGHALGWIEDGEWTEYTTVVDRGAYDLKLRVSGYARDGRVRVALGEEELATVEVPYTGGWHDWETVTVEGVSVERGGIRALRVEAEGGSFNLDWITLAGRR